MNIYTKKGDSGFTVLAGGQKVAKNSCLVVAYGALDEVSAHLAKCRYLAKEDKLRELLTYLLHKLANCAALAAGYQDEQKCPLNEADVTYLEKAIDSYSAKTPPINHILVPGGSELAIELNLARAVVRRSELLLWQAQNTEAKIPHFLLCYINRLSDLLFILMNYVNNEDGVLAETWAPSLAAPML